jgi:hypothetical protein
MHRVDLRFTEVSNLGLSKWSPHMTSYSRDLNPIEEAFAKVDHILRKIGAHSRDALIVFERCGYRRSTLPM